MSSKGVALAAQFGIALAGWGWQNRGARAAVRPGSGDGKNGWTEKSLDSRAQHTEPECRPSLHAAYGLAVETQQGCL